MTNTAQYVNVHPDVPAEWKFPFVLAVVTPAG